MMASTRQSLAVHIAPVFLRLTLGVVFLWAGWGKIRAEMPVEGPDAALLANLGIITKVAPPVAAPDVAPAKPLPASMGPTGAPGTGAMTLAQAGGGAPVTAGPPVYTAADFPDKVMVKRVWGLAVGIDHAAHPPAGKMALWPRIIGEGLWPKWLAIAVLVAEVGGGLGLLLGLLTRFSALSLAGVMAGAMWLTEIGPAVQGGTAQYGFLPGHEAYSQDWIKFFFQLTLLGACLALACAGPGVMAADRAIAALRAAGTVRRGTGIGSNATGAAPAGPVAKGGGKRG